ncbi:MAG: T9SS type A sorting domain-containing protein [Saprospiraceae bacterium]
MKKALALVSAIGWCCIFYYQSLYAQTQIGSSLDGQLSGNQFGSSLSLSADGTRLAIGAPFYDVGRGHVKVYELSAGNWVQVGSDIQGVTTDDLAGWSVALSGAGSRIVVGAPGAASGAGIVRVYEYNGTNWIQLGSDIQGVDALEQWGFSVAMTPGGTYLAAGATWNDGNGMNAGAVRVYALSGGNWIQQGSDILGKTAGDEFGFSVAISSDGQQVAAGAPNKSNGMGMVAVYGYTVGGWSAVGADIEGTASGDNLGNTVAISSDGTLMVIGAPGSDNNGTDAGEARVYENVGGSWLLKGAVLAGEAAEDQSGGWVSMTADGDRIAVGAPRNDGGAMNAGHVRLYDWVGSNWLQVGMDIDGTVANDLSGFPVVLSGDGQKVAVGTPEHDNFTGQVSVFGLGALPVAWLSFNGYCTERGNQLYWQTATEHNNVGFSVEASTDAKKWEEIGFVSGQGTSTAIHSYSFIHSTPNSPSTYYRLRQVDVDGYYSFSTTLFLQRKGMDSPLNVFPNPTEGKTTLLINAVELLPAVVTIYDAHGVKLRTLFANNNERLTLSFEQPGIYWAVVQQGRSVEHTRIVVQ